MNVAMDTSDPPRATLAANDARTCIEVLRAIEADRSTLTHLPPEQRRELLTLAGLVAKPERHDLVKMAKAFRRADRAAARRVSATGSSFSRPACASSAARPATRHCGSRNRRSRKFPRRSPRSARR
jgi:hypothetical protein